jgi:hypothetical protein
MVISAHAPVEAIENQTAPLIGPPKDEQPPYEYWITTDGMGRNVFVKLQITYRDTSNKTTVRDFDVRSFQRGAEGYVVEGFCHLRQRKRTLVTTGFVQTVDRDTGEFIDDIRAFLDTVYASTAESKFDAVMEVHHRSLKILLYLCKLDRALRQKERKILIAFIRERLADGGPDDVWMEAQLHEWSAPSKREFRRLVCEIRGEDQRHLETLVEIADRIIATNKTINDEERNAIAFMRKTLSKPPEAKKVFPPSTPDAEPEDLYIPIRWLLDKYTTELQILLAIAKVDGAMSEEGWNGLCHFFRRESDFDTVAENFLRRYTRSWGKETPNGFRIRCELLARDQVTIDTLRYLMIAARLIAHANPSEARLSALQTMEKIFSVG